MIWRLDVAELEHMTRILFKDYLDCVDACAKDMKIVDWNDQ